MRENLLFLFISGLVLGSGPCLVFCAPILASFVAVYKTSFKKGVISYLIFSGGRLLSYAIIGGLCAIFTQALNSDIFIGYLDIISIILGFLILIIGVATLIPRYYFFNKICSFLHKGNIGNSGILGFLSGLSPCLPLLGIMNYIVVISGSWFQAIIFALTFGLGTVISPLLLLIGISGKLAGDLSRNRRLGLIIRVVCALVLIFLGSRIILQKLLH